MYYEYTSTKKEVLTSVIKIVLQVIFYTSTKHDYYNNDNVRLLMTFEYGFKIFHMSRRKLNELNNWNSEKVYLVVCGCLLVVCGRLLVICSGLCLFAVVLPSFAGGLLLFTGGLWSFAGGLWWFVVVCWWFVVVVCFSN